MTGAAGAAGRRCSWQRPPITRGLGTSSGHHLLRLAARPTYGRWLGRGMAGAGQGGAGLARRPSCTVSNPM